ncbi:MAG: Pimeloyl-[acyl-carrier protein] methyl ester esterase [Candidatus Heimdallarchaeota archaeon LC_2]|nr:MAG: Pimeloyl-[acyl-carrier protein] methyl ester esterase [Candidatus Heimdallarchaeota archaeon LC_2]
MVQSIDNELDEITPLFLLHTSPLDKTYLQQSLVKEFKNSIPFYFIDLPSHGKSPDIENKNMSFRNMAEKIEELRVNLGFEKIHIYGHGIGGFVAQYFSAYHRNRVSSLICSNTSPNYDYREEMAWKIRGQYDNKIKQQFDYSYGKTDIDSLKSRFLTSLAFHFSPADEKKAEFLMNSISRFPQNAYIIISNFLIPKFDIRQYNQKLKIPVLIISGSKDVWPKKILNWYKTDIPHSDFIEFDSCHFPMIDEPAEYWNKINMWLENISLRE